MDKACRKPNGKFSELELTQEERRAVDGAAGSKEEIDTNNNVLAYMAGIMDCLLVPYDGK